MTSWASCPRDSFLEPHSKICISCLTVCHPDKNTPQECDRYCPGYLTRTRTKAMQESTTPRTKVEKYITGGDRSSINLTTVNAWLMIHVILMSVLLLVVIYMYLTFDRRKHGYGIQRPGVLELTASPRKGVHTAAAVPNIVVNPTAYMTLFKSIQPALGTPIRDAEIGRKPAKHMKTTEHEHTWDSTLANISITADVHSQMSPGSSSARPSATSWREEHSGACRNPAVAPDDNSQGGSGQRGSGHRYTSQSPRTNDRMSSTCSTPTGDGPQSGHSRGRTTHWEPSSRTGNRDYHQESVRACALNFNAHANDRVVELQSSFEKPSEFNIRGSDQITENPPLFLRTLGQYGDVTEQPGTCGESFVREERPIVPVPCTEPECPFTTGVQGAACHESKLWATECKTPFQSMTRQDGRTLNVGRVCQPPDYPGALESRLCLINLARDVGDQTSPKLMAENSAMDPNNASDLGTASVHLESVEEFCMGHDNNVHGYNANQQLDGRGLSESDQDSLSVELRLSISDMPPGTTQSRTGSTSSCDVTGTGDTWNMIMRLYDLVEAELYKYPWIVGCMISNEVLEVIVDMKNVQLGTEAAYDKLCEAVPQELRQYLLFTEDGPGLVVGAD